MSEGEAGVWHALAERMNRRVDAAQKGRRDSAVLVQRGVDADGFHLSPRTSCCGALAVAQVSTSEDAK